MKQKMIIILVCILLLSSGISVIMNEETVGSKQDSKIKNKCRSRGTIIVDCNGNGDYTNTFEGEEFKGKIDEVKIWNIARTSAQIKDNIYTICTGSETGLVGYWRFDEASGTTLKDYSVNANDGVLKNMDNSAWHKSDILGNN